MRAANTQAVTARRLRRAALALAAAAALWAAAPMTATAGASALVSTDPEARRLLQAMYIQRVPHATEPVDITLEDLQGKTVRLAELRGKVIFLNFWTTWCPSCRIEMPSLEKLGRQLDGGDFAIAAVNLQEPTARVKAFYEEFKLSFTVLMDRSGEVGQRFGVRQLPTTFILDKGGRIIGKALGPRAWDSPKSLALFRYLASLENTPPPAAAGLNRPISDGVPQSK